MENATMTHPDIEEAVARQNAEQLEYMRNWNPPSLGSGWGISGAINLAFGLALVGFGLWMLLNADDIAWTMLNFALLWGFP